MEQWELLTATKPSRYIGGETNQVRKDPSTVDLRFALAFPDTYEIGMSHLGIKILYHILNRMDGVYAERAFLPWTDRQDMLLESTGALASMETRTPLREFDVLGISLLYELSYTNVLWMLKLGGIPLLSRDRDMDMPLVIGGGSTVFNPEPVAEFFDAFLIGDGEEAVVDICQAVRQGKRERLSKDEMLKRLAGIEGVYVPSLFEPHYGPDGRLALTRCLLPGHRVRKRFLSSLEDAPFPVDPVIPFTQAIHDRISIEVSRGCTQGCRYCQAGMTYRPVRERSPETIRKIIKESVEKTGYETLSLLSLSVGDYSCLSPMIKKMVEECAPTQTAMSLPSLRIGTVDGDILRRVNSVRKTGVTIVPEAGTQRLRDVINKRITEEEILKTAADAYRTGHDLIKTYFMTGQPTERWDDLTGIIDLAGKISRSSGRKGDVHVSVSTFVPKSHTPFQWSAQITLEESRERLDYLRKGVRRLGLKLKWQAPELSWLEGVFSRSDRRLSGALLEAMRLGCRMDGWGEHMDLSRWNEALGNAGIDPSTYMHRDRDQHEPFPWDHLDSGVDRDFLWRDWQRALAGNQIPDCFTESCTNCGVCDFDTVRNISAEELSPEDKVEQRPRSGTEPGGAAVEAGTGWTRTTPPSRPETFVFKYRMIFEKTGDMKYLSHLELINVWHRALRRIGFPIKYSEGFHPSPKISFSNPLPTGVESLQEYCDLEATGRVHPNEFIAGINEALPAGLKVTNFQLFPSGKGSLMTNYRGGRYSADLNDLLSSSPDRADLIRSRVEDYNGADRFEARRERPGKDPVTVDLKRNVRKLTLEVPARINFDLEHVEGGISNPFVLLREVLGLTERESHQLGIVKKETFMA